VFVLASVFNFLDRQLLAAAAPLLKQEFSLTNAQYGQLIAVFSMVYALSTPAAGLFIDRVGLRIGSVLAVLLWSAAGAATGLTSSFSGLLACRVALAVGESAGIPAGTKASATYLEPRELGIGTATQSIGVSAGSVVAPLLIAALAPAFGWRSVFFVTGALGLLWIPLWLITARHVPARPSGSRRPIVMRALLRDPRLWGVAAANALVMTLYSLWMNWTTIYFVQERHLTVVQANQQFAWVPPVFATLGGFFGGWLAFRALRHGGDSVKVRMRLCWLIAPVLVVTAAVPFIPSTTLAAVAMAVSFFACLAIVNNLQMIPVDLFGPERAAFSGAVLTCSFALMQTLISPIIGALVDGYGFAIVCLAMSMLPLAGVGVLAMATRVSPVEPAPVTV
jgi:ACS family hexuronate transporter-like MFS transporter